jgi:hypothetical protein
MPFAQTAGTVSVIGGRIPAPSLCGDAGVVGTAAPSNSTFMAELWANEFPDTATTDEAGAWFGLRNVWGLFQVIS